MSNSFCVVVLACGADQARISGPTERAVANAAETILRRLVGTGLNVTLQIECRDPDVGQRIASYLVDVAIELEVLASVERQPD